MICLADYIAMPLCVTPLLAARAAGSAFSMVPKDATLDERQPRRRIERNTASIPLRVITTPENHDGSSDAKLA